MEELVSRSAGELLVPGKKQEQWHTPGVGTPGGLRLIVGLGRPCHEVALQVLNYSIAHEVNNLFLCFYCEFMAVKYHKSLSDQGCCVWNRLIHIAGSKLEGLKREDTTMPNHVFMHAHIIIIMFSRAIQGSSGRAWKESTWQVEARGGRIPITISDSIVNVLPCV